MILSQKLHISSVSSKLCEAFVDLGCISKIPYDSGLQLNLPPPPAHHVLIGADITR